MSDQAGPNTSVHNVADNLVNLFSAPLAAEWQRKRRPYRIKAAFQTAQTSPPESTPRVFLDHGGFVAWVGYFLASSGEGHYSGRSAQQDLISRLHALPTDDKAAIAQRVAASPIHPSATAEITSIEQEFRSESERHVASKRRRIDGNGSDDSQAMSSRPTVPLSEHRDEWHNGYAESPPSNNVPVQPDETGQSISGASIEGIQRLFPDYLGDAIRRDEAADQITAAVMMNFPPRSFGEVACIMTLVVQPNKVGRLAFLLYGVHLESEGRSQEVVFEGGAKLKPNPQSILQGARPDVLSKVFGSITAEAIATAPFRKREMRQGTRTTRCVSMTIDSEADATALITLTLGLREGYEIYKMLYQ